MGESVGTWIWPWLAVALGGSVGAVLRYGISDWIQKQHQQPWPLGTLTVNVIGCCAIGLAMAWVDRGSMGPEARLFWVTGMLGALTTFSTFGWDTLVLLRSGWIFEAFCNVAANTLIGLGAVVLGFHLGRYF